MAKIFSIIFALALIAVISAGPIENENEGADGDLATADSVGYGYYAAPAPIYYGGYGGGYGGGYKYGGYRSYGRYYGGYYRPRIYPVWG
ncbi:uncharacterized protein Dana_GF12296 [Drosophila ananassae]|uniref:Uncharacterized protein n=1 Tax=Drosophila ananassae TaxID=7217 RepID=B3MH23_DROAN|nr:neuropeptide-like protein 30 [Drosophila ananassae]EDV35782.1 uncharacterized protein Dana_GF12296 [Drosophila ananassae]